MVYVFLFWSMLILALGALLEVEYPDMGWYSWIIGITSIFVLGLVMVDVINRYVKGKNKRKLQ